MRIRTAQLLCLTALAAASGLAACGGEADQRGSLGSTDNPLVAESADGTAGRSNEAADGAAAAGRGYEALVANQVARPRSRFTPCNLVTRAQARAIVDAPVQAPFEAPQGPTCIYRAEQGGTFIALAVQSLDLDAVKERIQQRRRVKLGGRPGYCGHDGRPMLYVALEAGKVLSVAGPCDVASQFAEQAMREF